MGFPFRAEKAYVCRQVIKGMQLLEGEWVGVILISIPGKFKKLSVFDGVSLGVGKIIIVPGQTFSFIQSELPANKRSQLLTFSGEDLSVCSFRLNFEVVLDVRIIKYEVSGFGLFSSRIKRNQFNIEILFFKN